MAVALNRLISSSWTRSTATTFKQIHTAIFPLAFRASPCLMAEPLKRRKKLDPSIIREREERKKKKLAKAIRQLEKRAHLLKPIDEANVSMVLITEKEVRTRPVVITEEQKEYAAFMKKSWARYQRLQRCWEIQQLNKLVLSQKAALDELRLESEELYQAAVQLDPDLLPFKYLGPAVTPAIKNYDSPDGSYSNISKRW